MGERRAVAILRIGGDGWRKTVDSTKYPLAPFRCIHIYMPSYQLLLSFLLLQLLLYLSKVPHHTMTLGCSQPPKTLSVLTESPESGSLSISLSS